MCDIYKFINFFFQKSISIYIKKGKDYTKKDKLGISGNRVWENRIRLNGSLKQNIKNYLCINNARHL